MSCNNQRGTGGELYYRGLCAWSDLDAITSNMLVATDAECCWNNTCLL